ncbi:hypothetical protein TPA0909_39860 [Streptomyces albus]|nr:hypothetical protein TPA0909_39860 [Streptomyces albus]
MVPGASFVRLGAICVFLAVALRGPHSPAALLAGRTIPYTEKDPRPMLLWRQESLTFTT